MNYGSTELKASRFETGDGIREYHISITVSDPELTFTKQTDAILATLKKYVSTETKAAKPMFMRWFLSDSATQEGQLREKLSGMAPCAISIVEQPPLGGCKAALWIYLLEGAGKPESAGGFTKLEHGIYTHLWTASSTMPGGSSKKQTRQIFLDYIEKSGDAGCTLADNCIRTWFFVQNIDVNYSGMVNARNEVFSAQGLDNTTHYIASTGIGGRTASSTASVMMDAYSVKGLCEGQIRYLHAPTHLNRTSEYGVSFERGTMVQYGDRRHVFISGTASIDKHGKVLYTGDIRKQTARMIENVEKLLENAGCTLDNMAQIIVYLRDMADYKVVCDVFTERFPDKPCIITHAPVCRPGWLIEMECMAVSAEGDSSFAKF